MRRGLLLLTLLLAAGAAAAEAPAREIPARVVAIGDVHGDLEATRRALRLAGAIDDQDRWIGGALVVVQTGDVLDRGDDEKEILALLDRLEVEAKAAGGRLVRLLGNHELMNARGDMRYVTGGGFDDYGGSEESRRAAFRPGSPLAKRLADFPLVAVVGDSVFAHGGLLPKHVEYGLDRLNREAAAWLRGERRELPAILRGSDSPQWLRRFSEDVSAGDCKVLADMLASLGVKRLVVGHTIQRSGITSACEGRVWRIDVGMARYYHLMGGLLGGGDPAALEISDKGARPLRAR